MSLSAIMLLSMTAALLAVFLYAVYQNVAQGQRQNAEALDELKERVRELEDEQFRRDMEVLDSLDVDRKPEPWVPADWTCGYCQTLVQNGMYHDCKMGTQP